MCKIAHQNYVNTITMCKLNLQKNKIQNSFTYAYGYAYAQCYNFPYSAISCDGGCTSYTAGQN